MRLIDSHAHVYWKDFNDDVSAVMDRAKDAGVEKTVMIGATLKESGSAVDFANDHENVWATVGAHPHDAENVNADTIVKLKSLAEDPIVVAIGECGLDYFKMRNTKEAQLNAFKLQLELAQEIEKPVVIHARDAWDDIFAVLKSFKLRGVIHSFTGGVTEVKKALDLGFFVAFNGIVTFPKNDELQEAAAFVPLDRMLLETDSPFLAPQKMRGERNEPAYVRFVADKLVELRPESLEEISEQTSKNAEALFGI